MPDVWLGNNMDGVLSGLSSRTPILESLREQTEWNWKNKEGKQEMKREEDQAKQQKGI